MAASSTIKSSLEYFKAKRYNRMLRLQKGEIQSFKNDDFLSMLRKKDDTINDDSSGDQTSSLDSSLD